MSRVDSIGSSGDPGLHAYVTGPAASAADSVKIFKGIDSALLYATLGVVVVLLLLTYRSPILWLLPIMSAGVSLIAAEAVIYELVVHEGLVVNGQTAGILVVLVLGASTDYALLLIARYREELRRHEDRHEAMAVALRQAGPAIFASGLTVIAALLCLLAADSADISGLGRVAAIFGFAGADNSIPLFAFVFLVALGIDYNIFRMTRVREESIRSGTRRGMLTGLAATGRVITAAGLVLAGTFATLATLPLVILTEIGFTVAPGVLLDTLVVRSVPVTALTLDIGRHMWWPSRLAARRDDDPAARPSGQLSRAQ